MSSRALSGQVALVTGASSGIGEALARELARRGARLALCARRLDRLRQLAHDIEHQGGSALPIECDVTVDGDLPRAVAETVARFGRLDLAIANAGFGVTGPIEALSLDDHRRQLETNLFGVLRTAYAAFEPLRASRGCLAIVGSVSSYLAVPGTAAYAESKFAVRAFAETAAAEWRPHRVAVVLLLPGFVESEIRQVDNRGRLTEAADPVPRWLAMPRERAARQMVRAIERRRNEQVITAHGRVAVLLARHAPGLVRAALRLGARWKPTGG
jgi:short-subunit dehydrogenase